MDNFNGVKNNSNNITLLNINKGDVIHYSILLIKGIIQHDDANCPNNNIKTLSVFVTQDSVKRECTNINILNGKFKTLVELNIGLNTVHFVYCCTSTSTQINRTNRETDFTIVPLYIINDGHNGEFQAPSNEENGPESACRRILLGCKLLQCLLAEKLSEQRLGRKSFQLEEETCKIFQSSLHYNDLKLMSQQEIWSHIGREILTSPIGDEKKKYLGFLSCTRYKGEKYVQDLKSHEDIVKLTDGYVALGGGGLALVGSACLYSWPDEVDQVFKKFLDETVVDKTKFMDDSCYRGTIGGCFATTLGSVLHELCHTFDLGHTPDGIMGRGFDNLHKFFINMPKETSISCYEINTNQNYNETAMCRRNETLFRVNVPDDETYFTSSCLVFLFHHRYFNNFNKKGKIVFDESTRILKSTAGLRVVELRTKNDEMVKNSFVFTGKVLRYHFRIPEDCSYDVLVVEDNSGQIFKTFHK